MYGNISIKIKIINSLNNFTFTYRFHAKRSKNNIQKMARISTLVKYFFTTKY